MKNKSYLIGVREDGQSQAIAKYVDYQFYWDDFYDSWDVYTDGQSVTIIDLKLNKEYGLDESNATLYLRFAAGDSAVISDTFTTITAVLENAIIGCANDFGTPTNKLSQLEYFGGLAPTTRVTNRLSSLMESRDCVTKSISWVRSNVCSTESFLKHIDNTTGISDRLNTPVLTQERVTGREYKAHFRQRNSRLEELNVKIENISDLMGSVDYRYNDQETVYTRIHSAPVSIQELASKIVLGQATKFIDIDYFVGDSGNCKVLEWNDSPAPASFEKSFGRVEFEYCRSIVRDDIPIIIRSREDSTGTILGELCGNLCLEVCLEDYNITWSYFISNGELTIVNHSKHYSPSKIYLRSTSDSNEELSLLYEACEWGEIEVIGASRLNFVNGSKPLQLSSTLNSSLANSSQSPVVLPKTWLINGVMSSDVSSGNKITKSISGVRSIVVAEDVFLKWPNLADSGSIGHFQEKIDGDIIRVHVVGYSKVISMESKKSETTDHRYASNPAEFKTHTLPHSVIQFCRNVAIAEKNPLVGIDFILDTEGIYYCLEANPQPGWGWYVGQCQSDNSLANDVMEYLIS